MGTWRMFLRMCPYFFQDDWLKIDGEISVQKFRHFSIKTYGVVVQPPYRVFILI